MIDRLACLAALGPGLGLRSNNPVDLHEFAQRRVDHLRRKVDAGDIDPEKLRGRLLARFGDAAGNIVDEDGSIDFDRLRDLITTQQATKLQDRLHGWLGDDANGIVSPDGTIDRERIEALHAAENVGHLQARLIERFSDRTDGVVGNDGSIDIDALRELFISQEDERSYEPAGLRHEPGWTADQGHPFLDLLIWCIAPNKSIRSA